MGSKGGSGGGSNQMGFQATSSTYSPNPEAMQAYRNALGMAENVAQIPYEQYQGQMVAGFTPDQLASFQGTREMQGMAQPYINAATSAVNQSLQLADPRNFTPAALQQYYNPYQQNVIESTRAMMAQQNAQQQADLTARAIQQGAYGGDRSGVARAALMGQQALANQQVLSGLQQQGYQQAVNQYNQQQQQAIGAAQQGAYSLGQLGLQGQQAALQGIQALLGTGGLQQNLAQQQLTAAYNQWLQERAYPYQQANFYAGIVSGIAPNMGGTTNTTGFGTGSTQQQQAQGGGGGAGMLTSALSFLPMLMSSDKDDKTDIKYLGKDKNGEKLYSYRYKGDPKSYPKVVGPMAQDIEKDEPERVHEIGGHKVVEGLGHLSPSQREGRANGGGMYSSPTVDPYAYQQSAYQANQALDPGFKTGLEAVIDPAMANEIAKQRWVSHSGDQSQNQQTLDEQIQYRNPDFNLFPYFQDGEQSQSPFDGNAEQHQMYADGGEVGGGDFGSLIKSKTPFGAANSYVEALPITPGRAEIPQPPKGFNWLPGLPGGGPQSGGGGGGGGGGQGGMPKMPKFGGSKAASAGAASPEAASASEAAAHTESAAPVAPEAASGAPAVPDMGAAAAPAPAADAGLGGLGGGLGIDNLFSGLGGMFGGFSHGGRVHMAAGGAGGGGAGGAGAGDGAIGSSGFAGALGKGVGAIPGVIGEPGSGTLGSLAPKIQMAPTEGPFGKMSYGNWLNRAMAIDPGPQLTPEQQGMPSLPNPATQSNRPWLPGETQSQVIGNQNPGIDPLMMMMAGGKGATNLAMGAMLGQQNAANSAREMQAAAQAKRASILASPRDVGGYFQKLGSNVVNPRTGLFNIDYTGAYYVPHYKQGGRVKRANGGFNYAPSMQLYYDLINSGKMTPQAAAGYAGNFSYEASGRGQNQLNPGAIEGGVPFNKAGLGYGQWTNAHRGSEGRHTDFLNYAKDIGKPWSSHEANLGYFNKERAENPFVAKADVKVQSQPTIPAAATSVMRDYERPGAAEAARSLPQRIGMSEHIGDIAQSGNPFQGEALAEQSHRASLPEPIVDSGTDVVAADPGDMTTGGEFADGGRIAMQRGGGLDERTAALANRAMSYFLGKGYSKAAAAGIVGNLLHESGGRLNPAAHGDLNLGPARSAWGIGQWREGRFRNLQNFARAIGRDWRDFDTQLAFVDRELKSDYRNAYRGIASARTPQEAAAQMMMYYEIPAHKVTGSPSTYTGWSDRARYASMLGGQDYRPSAVAGYGAPASAPVRTLAVRPLTGERAVSAYDAKPAVAAPVSPYAGSVLNRINPADPSGPLLGQPKAAPATAPVAPQKGFSLASLNPVSSAQAADMNVFPEDDKGRSFGDVGARMRGMTQKFAYAPGVYETDDIKTAFGENARRGDMPGDVPYAVTMAGAPMGPWDDGKGFSEAVVASDEKSQPKPSTEARPAHPAASGNGPYWGDYRDYEPWKSDPIGGFFDELSGDRPHSAHKGASMYDVGGGETQPGGFDILKELGFAKGGTVRDEDKTTKRPGVSSGWDQLGSVPERMAAEQLARMGVDPQTPQMGPGVGSWWDVTGSLPERLAMEQRARMAPERKVYHQDPNFRPTYHDNMGPTMAEGPRPNIPDWNPNIPVQSGGYPRTISEMYPVDSVVAQSGAPAASPAASPAMAPASRSSASQPSSAASQPSQGGRYWGDYRDYEPWASDPIGAAFDKIVGDTPHSAHKGASMWDVGGGETAPASLGDLFKQYGGRVNMADGGDPMAKIDPEMLSGEPMSAQPAGFDPAVVAPEETPDIPESRVVATDAPDREAPEPQQGFGGLRSPITGQPMTFGPLSQAMLAAGLGMMASDRVNPLQAIGEGGLRGLEYYQSASAQERAQQAAQAKARHDLEREKIADLRWRQEFEHKKRVSEIQERARQAAMDRLLRGEQLKEMQASPAYKQKMTQMETLQKESDERQDAADKAENNINLGNEMMRMLESGKVDTGLGAENLLKARKAIKEYGWEPAKKIIGFDPEKVSYTERFAQMAGNLTLSQMGGKLGGGVSNADLGYIQSINPGLGADIDTNKRAVDAYIKLNQRAVQVADFEEKYRAKHNGVLGPEFRKELRKWADEHPLFSEEQKKDYSAPASVSKYTPEQAMEEIKRRRAGAR